MPESQVLPFFRTETGYNTKQISAARAKRAERGIVDAFRRLLPQGIEKTRQKALSKAAKKPFVTAGVVPRTERVFEKRHGTRRIHA